MAFPPPGSLSCGAAGGRGGDSGVGPQRVVKGSQPTQRHTLGLARGSAPSNPRRTPARLRRRPRAVGGTRRVAPGTLQRLSWRSSPWSPCHRRSRRYHSRRTRCRRAATSRALLSTDYTHDRRHSDEGGARGVGGPKHASPIFEGPDAQHPAPPPEALHAAAPSAVVDDPTLHGGQAEAMYTTTVTASQPSIGWGATGWPSPSACGRAARSARVCWCSA